MGLLLLGEKRTQDTHSVWPSSCKIKSFVNPQSQIMSYAGIKNVTSCYLVCALINSTHQRDQVIHAKFVIIIEQTNHITKFYYLPDHFITIRQTMWGKCGCQQ